jgi:hypothetical protein
MAGGLNIPELVELLPGTDIAETEPAELNPALAEQLEPHARKIERLQSKAILRIAGEAAKIHKTLRYYRNEGGYTGYMKKRLGYSSSSAYRLLDVHTRFGANPSQIWERFPATALCQLASASVPKEALDEVTARIEAGERPSCALVAEVIGKAKSTTAISIPAETDKSGAQAFHEDVTKAITGKRQKTGDRAKASEPTPDEDIPASVTTAGSAESPDESAERMKAAHAEADAREHDDADTEPTTITPADYEGGASVRARVLADYFAMASGDNILKRLRDDKRKISDFLDALTVDGMLQAMSPEFGKQLRAKLNPKKPKPLPSTVEIGTDEHGQPIFKLQVRGDRSRPH